MSGISIAGLDEQRARLLSAALFISAGKFSVMGGFDDLAGPDVMTLDPVAIVERAIAGSHTVGPYPSPS